MLSSTSEWCYSEGGQACSVQGRLEVLLLVQVAHAADAAVHRPGAGNSASREAGVTGQGTVAGQVNRRLGNPLDRLAAE